MSTEETRARLIEAAERLFGERGIDAVSLREIAAAAGQRNTAAIHYHFGSRDALIEGILERRMRDINARRLEMLETLQRGGRAHDLRGVLEAAAWPLAEQALSGRGGRAYIRFLAQAYGHARAAVAGAIRGAQGRGWQQVFALSEAIVSHVPSSVLVLRHDLLAGHLLNALADYLRARPADADPDEAEFRLFVNNLIDCMVGALHAPVSAATREAAGATVGA